MAIVSAHFDYRYVARGSDARIAKEIGAFSWQVAINKAPAT
jgi:hypothetical protein